LRSGAAVGLPGMIGEHPSMLEVYDLVRRVAPTDLPVVVQGPTGSGKELVSRALHHLSENRNGAFVDLNCAAIPENLVEGELFGWEKGGFTGAHQRRLGLLEHAAGGTLFLDEACSLPKAVQSKLLRVLELHELRRLGGHASIPSRFRVVLAVQRTLTSLVETGDYLVAFAHRVNGMTLELPPLNARGTDVVLLANHFLAQSNARYSSSLRFSEEVEAELQRLPWTGNVRELLGVVSRVRLHAMENEVTLDAFRASLGTLMSPANELDLRKELERYDGNHSRAARALRMPLSTFRARLSRLNGGSTG
jgi:DNA-binding NtrC family response regulator